MSFAPSQHALARSCSPKASPEPRHSAALPVSPSSDRALRGHAAQWKDAGLHRLHTRLLGISAETTPEGGDVLSVRTRMGAADKQFGVLVDYTWTSDGESLALRTRVQPEGTWVNAGYEVESARIGLELVLAGETTSKVIQEFAAAAAPTG